jgi:hypothetical protein
MRTREVFLPILRQLTLDECATNSSNQIVKVLQCRNSSNKIKPAKKSHHTRNISDTGASNLTSETMKEKKYHRWLASNHYQLNVYQSHTTRSQLVLATGEIDAENVGLEPPLKLAELNRAGSSTSAAVGHGLVKQSMQLPRKKKIMEKKQIASLNRRGYGVCRRAWCWWSWLAPPQRIPCRRAQSHFRSRRRRGTAPRTPAFRPGSRWNACPTIQSKPPSSR